MFVQELHIAWIRMGITFQLALLWRRHKRWHCDVVTNLQCFSDLVAAPLSICFCTLISFWCHARPKEHAGAMKLFCIGGHQHSRSCRETEWIQAWFAWTRFSSLPSFACFLCEILPEHFTLSVSCPSKTGLSFFSMHAILCCHKIRLCF